MPWREGLVVEELAQELVGERARRYRRLTLASRHGSSPYFLVGQLAQIGDATTRPTATLPHRVGRVAGTGQPLWDPNRNVLETRRGEPGCRYDWPS